MMKFLTRCVVFTVSILTSYLISGAIEDRVLLETEKFRPLTATLLGMGIIILVFAPVFAYTERITEAAIKASLRQTKAGAGKILGIIVFICVVFIVLVALFLDKWFGISIVDAF